MKQHTKEELKGKFVIAYDTIVDGNQCMLDEDGNPELFNSADEAFIEIFDSNYSMLETHRDSDQLEDLNEGVTPELVTEMGIVLSGGNADEMRAWMERHPQCNDSGEWVEKAEDFIMNRKTIIGENGGFITGKKLNEI